MVFFRRKKQQNSRLPAVPVTEKEADFAKLLADIPAEDLGEECKTVVTPGERAEKIFHVILMFVVFSVFFLSLYNFAVRLFKYRESERIYSQDPTQVEEEDLSVLQATASSKKSPALTALGTSRGSASSVITEEDDSDKYITDQTRLEKWKTVNPDIVGWIEVPGDTMINYPLVFASSNEIYLTYAADGTYNPAGSIFVDAECQKPLSKNFNTVIWGHHMDFGAPMFANLVKYGEDPDYWQENKYIKIYTEEDGMAVYEIFAAYKMSPYYEENSCFDTRVETWEDKTAFLQKIKERNVLDSDMETPTDGQYVTLCTCADNGSNRYIVEAIRIEPDEDGEYPV